MSASTPPGAAHHEPREEYTGPADVDAVPVRVTLRGYLEPIDGHFHWYGRIAANEVLDHRSGSTVTLTTPHGRAEGRIADLDPWGRFRISGMGTPPF